MRNRKIDATYRSDDTGAVGSDQTGLVLCLQDVRDANHVCTNSVSVYAPTCQKSRKTYRAEEYPQ